MADLRHAIAQTPEPPYYAVIFTSLRTDGDQGYTAMSQHMVELAAQQPGFLGVESARDEVGITVSYWSDLASIQNWKRHAEHWWHSAEGGTSGIATIQSGLPGSSGLMTERQHESGGWGNGKVAGKKRAGRVWY